MILSFWLCLFIIFYTFFGYALLLFLLILIRRIVHGRRKTEYDFKLLPTITVIVAAYNEEDLITEKIKNTLALNYPEEKIAYLFVTDGSTDRTPQLVSEYAKVQLLHLPERKGKINAMHRAMLEARSEIIVFTDANTELNRNALINIARHYQDPKIGAVSGEKRVRISETSDATAGEGFYWKYESVLKRWDAELFTVVGAAGEIFSIRNSLYQPVPTDTILDDFMITLLIASKGYRIVYEPAAYALESSSADTREELKRKIRIAAGGIQSIRRLSFLLNPFRYPVLSFQFISHRVLRWTITPFLLPLALILNIFIVATNSATIYQVLLICQITFYGASVTGWLLQQREIKVKLLFIPYYFCMMNYAVIAGIRRHLMHTQSTSWEKVKRKS